MSCEVERMNYGRMLVSPVVRMNCSVYSNVLQRLSQHYTQLQGTVGELGRDGTGGQLWREVLCCVVSVGFQLRTPGREGRDLSEKANAVCRLREKRGQRPRAALHWKVTDTTFSKCRAIYGGRSWVWIWDKGSCFSVFCFAFKREVPLFSTIKGSYWNPFPLKALDCLWQTIHPSKRHY